MINEKKYHVHLFLSLSVSLSPWELKTPKSILVPKTYSSLSAQLGSFCRPCSRSSTTSGAAKTQQGFIVDTNRKTEARAKGTK